MDIPAKEDRDEEDQPLAATPLSPPEEDQPATSIDQQARLRQIAVAYLSTSATKRLDIAKRLGVLEDSDLEIPSDRVRYGTILRRIRDADKVDKLAEELGI
jgi:hypothetical protein